MMVVNIGGYRIELTDLAPVEILAQAVKAMGSVG